MRRFLFRVLALHWTAVFATLAVLCAINPRGGIGVPLRFLGVEAAALDESGTEASTFFAVSFLFVAVLFLWVLIESLLGLDGKGSRGQGAARNAFAGAALAFTLLLGAAALEPAAGSFVTIECLLAAVLASYVAVGIEEAVPGEEHGPPGAGSGTARRMALGAAHASLLSALSGRGGDEPGWRR